MSLLKSNIIRIILIGILILNVILLKTFDVSLLKVGIKEKTLNVKHKEKKYILQWTAKKTLAPFHDMGEGHSAFVAKKCKYTNCFVTDNKNYFLNMCDFDAIAFNGREVIYLGVDDIPKCRSAKQKYIFGCTESSDRFPACHPIFDGFFNWTWTYKIDSDVRRGYVTVKDLYGNVVGPKIDMKWPKLQPIGEDLKSKLSSKSKAAAWFVSNCHTTSRREYFVNDVQKELKPFGWTVDVYGSCGTFNCPRSKESSCFNLIDNDYYFYFSFENSFAEDYVTEKLLTALNNYAVPVVYGAANYTRFLPPGSYLDALRLGPKRLAQRMYEIISNKTLYYDFFRWRNHYVYTWDNNDICKLCEMMNSEVKMAHSVWMNFRAWWNGARYKHNCKS